MSCLFAAAADFVLAGLSDTGVPTRPDATAAAVLCQDGELLQFVMAEGLTLHSCHDSLSILALNKQCLDFQQDAPPAYEGHQIRALGEFIGSANLLDVAYHVYAGDAARISSKDVLRVLFADHFHPRSIYFLLGNFSSGGGFMRKTKLEVSIATQDDSLKQRIVKVISACAPTAMRLVRFVDVQTDRVSGSRLFGSSLRSLSGRGYDYIEYNGGPSLTGDYVRQLRDLRTVRRRCRRRSSP